MTSREAPSDTTVVWDHDKGAELLTVIAVFVFPDTFSHLKPYFSRKQTLCLKPSLHILCPVKTSPRLVDMNQIPEVRSPCSPRSSSHSRENQHK